MALAIVGMASAAMWDIPDEPQENLEEDLRVCDRPGCQQAGLHPAPKGRDRLRDYYWFCKEHAREYNAAWNFFKGLGPGEIEAQVRRDTVWDRPTWPMGAKNGPRRAGNDFDMDDRTGLFGEGPRDDHGPLPPESAARGTELWAMRMLDLSHPLTLTALKARYKELAKLLHPDVNGGDSETEERLKRINLAYATLRASLSS